MASPGPIGRTQTADETRIWPVRDRSRSGTVERMGNRTLTGSASTPDSLPHARTAASAAGNKAKNQTLESKMPTKEKSPLKPALGQGA